MTDAPGNEGDAHERSSPRAVLLSYASDDADGAIAELSHHRARAIRVELTTGYRFAADRLTTGGVGASRPIFPGPRQPGALEAGRACCRARKLILAQSSRPGFTHGGAIMKFLSLW